MRGNILGDLFEQIVAVRIRVRAAAERLEPRHHRVQRHGAATSTGAATGCTGTTDGVGAEIANGMTTRSATEITIAMTATGIDTGTGTGTETGADRRLVSRRRSESSGDQRTDSAVCVQFLQRNGNDGGEIARTRASASASGACGAREAGRSVSCELLPYVKDTRDMEKQKMGKYEDLSFLTGVNVIYGCHRQ